MLPATPPMVFPKARACLSVLTFNELTKIIPDYHNSSRHHFRRFEHSRDSNLRLRILFVMLCLKEENTGVGG